MVSHMSDAQKFSVVLPVFNEQDNLKTLFSEIRAAADSTGRPWEAVFVDDCSTDRSLSIIKQLAEHHDEVRYVAFAENRGQSAAFCAGFDAVQSDIVVTMDSDLQNDAADIPGMLAVFGDECEMVIGWRSKRRDTFIKRISSKIANRIRDAIMDDGVHDTGCSLKVMRTDLLLKLPRFKNMHRYFPILMKMQGARIKEVKVNHRERHTGESKYGTLDRAVAGIYDLIGVKWLINRHIDYVVREKSSPMTLPAYWWLLALVILVQGAFFVRIGILRLRRKGVQPLARMAAAAVVVSGLSGLAYGLLQRDPLFFLGQGCLLIIYYLLQRRSDVEREQ